MKKSGWWKGAIQYALGLGLLTFVIWMNWSGKPAGSDHPATPGLKDLLDRTPNFVPLLIAALCIATATALQFYRWFLLVRALDLPFTLRGAFRLGLVGYFYNTFLPGSVGGDLVKAFFIAKGQPGRRAAAVATVVADRMFGLFGLILYVAAVGGAFWAAGNPQIEGNVRIQTIIKGCAVLVGITLLGWVVLGFLPQQRADRFAGRLHKVPRVGHTLAELWYTVWQYRQRSATVLACLALSAVTHTCYILIFHFAVQVFPTDDPGDVATFAEHAAVAPIGYITEAIPLPIPGGVGVGETIFGTIYTLVGRPFNVGFVGRLCMRMVQWSIGLVGYVAYLRMKDELPIADVEAAEEQADPMDEHLPPDAKGQGPSGG